MCTIDSRKSKHNQLKTSLFLIIWLVLLSALVSCSTGGTTGTGARSLEILGTLLDPEGKPIVGVSVTLEEIASVRSNSFSITDRDGRFFLVAEDPSQSQIRFAGKGIDSAVPLDFVPANAKSAEATFEVNQAKEVKETSVNVTEEYPSEPVPNPTAAPQTPVPTNIPGTIVPTIEPTNTPRPPAGSTPTPQPTSTPNTIPTIEPTLPSPTPTPQSTSTPAGFQLGDLNCDGAVNCADIDPFVLAYVDPANYPTQFPDCDINLADMNGDGVINIFDLNIFTPLMESC